jgi:hypothetical protein
LRVGLAARGHAHQHGGFDLLGGFVSFGFQQAVELGIAAGRRVVGGADVPGTALAVVVFGFGH